MTSKIKVDNINKVSDDSNIIKKCGTTTTIGSGASNPIVVDGSAVTIGRCGGTVALASGATQTGFGRTGTVDWDTTPKTATFTAVSGDGFFANTTGSAFTMNLPAGVASAIVSVADYAGTWDTNALTVSPNGTDKIGGVNNDVVLNTKGQSVTLVFADSTQGWVNVQDSTSNVRGNAFIEATGGTITTSGNDKIHTFTGPGTFTVSGTAECAANDVVSYMVVAGGGSGAKNDVGGGGGAGGFREVVSPSAPYTASPLDGYPSAPNRITVTAQAYPITVGGGGAQATGGNTSNPGNPSVFSTITSTAGGGGGKVGNGAGDPGGSGGGGAHASGAGGSGNTPPVSPPQGNNGGAANSPSGPVYGAGGGGGAGAAGTTGTPSVAGVGGDGVATSITGSSVTRGGGGGGARDDGVPSGGGAGGSGGGGKGGSGTVNGVDGTANTGGGGGGSGDQMSGGGGGSGIVVIRYKYQ
jgi:hypothetical protein